MVQKRLLLSLYGIGTNTGLKRVSAGDLDITYDEQCGKGEVVAKGTVEDVTADCFPQLYQALSTNPPDQVITL